MVNQRIFYFIYVVVNVSVVSRYCGLWFKRNTPLESSANCILIIKLELFYILYFEKYYDINLFLSTLRSLLRPLE